MKEDYNFYDYCLTKQILGGYKLVRKKPNLNFVVQDSKFGLKVN